MPIQYTRVGWQDAPSTDTPIDAANLNHMDNGILALAEAFDEEVPQLQEQMEDVLEGYVPLQTGVTALQADVTTLQEKVSLYSAVWVVFGSITGTGDSVTTTKNDSRINEFMKCAGYYLSNPVAQTGDWTVTTGDGSVTVSGPVNGTTSLEIMLVMVPGSDTLILD